MGISILNDCYNSQQNNPLFFEWLLFNYTNHNFIQSLEMKIMPIIITKKYQYFTIMRNRNNCKSSSFYLNRGLRVDLRGILSICERAKRDVTH